MWGSNRTSTVISYQICFKAMFLEVRVELPQTIVADNTLIMGLEGRYVSHITSRKILYSVMYISDIYSPDDTVVGLTFKGYLRLFHCL